MSLFTLSISNSARSMLSLCYRVRQLQAIIPGTGMSYKVVFYFWRETVWFCIMLLGTRYRLRLSPPASRSESQSLSSSPRLSPQNRSLQTSFITSPLSNSPLSGTQHHSASEVRLPEGDIHYWATTARSEEHTSELQSHSDLVCRLLLEKKKKKRNFTRHKHPQNREKSPNNTSVYAYT